MENNNNVKRWYENEFKEDGRTEVQTLEFIRSKIIISRYLSMDKMEIADVCAGSGAYSFWLAEMGHNVHILDLAQNHIEIAKQKSAMFNIPIASFNCADARNLPYDANSMDIVLVMGALYHLQSYSSRLKCLTEAYRVLKSSGIVICTVMCRYNAIIAPLKYKIPDAFPMDFIERILNTGLADGKSLPMAYSHFPSEIVRELSSARFKNIKSIAVEGVANAYSDNILPVDKEAAARLLKCIELVESAPEIIGISRNIIAVGQKCNIQ